MFEKLKQAFRQARYNAALETILTGVKTLKGQFVVVPGAQRWPAPSKVDYATLALDLERKHGLIVLTHCLICNCGNADCTTVSGEPQALAVGNSPTLAWDAYRDIVRSIFRAELEGLRHLEPDFDPLPWLEFNLIEIELMRQQLCEKFRIQLTPFVARDVLAQKVR